MKTAVLILALFLAGCGNPATVSTPPPVTRPGAANQFDSKTHDVLLAVQVTIEGDPAKNVKGLRQIVIESYPQLRVQMNGLISAYGDVMKAYKAYHAAVTAGQAFDEPALQIQVNGVVASAAALSAQAVKK